MTINKPVHHSVRFYRNPDNGSFRAVCTCGWIASGDLASLQSAAATHDLHDWPETQEDNANA